jgi:hypothetical protein
MRFAAATSASQPARGRIMTTISQTGAAAEIHAAPKAKARNFVIDNTGSITSIYPRSHQGLDRFCFRAGDVLGVPVHPASAEVEGGFARVSERVPLLGVHNSNKTSTTAVAKMPTMVQIDGFFFSPYIATSL